APSRTATYTLSLHDALPISRRVKEASDHSAELEDRQVHGHHQAADDDAEEHHDHGFEKLRQTGHRIIDLLLVEVRDLAEHGIELDRKSTRLNSSHVKISYAV